jgi:hypothetical protein
MGNDAFYKNAIPEPYDDVLNPGTLIWRGPLGDVRLGPGCTISIEDNGAEGNNGDAIVMAQCLLAAAQRIY